MSYILEALKKSEQQRKQGDVPTLQTIHLPRPEQPSTASWPYLVIVLLLVSLAFVLGWLQPWQDRPVAETTPAQAQPMAEPVASAPPAATAPPVTPARPEPVAPPPVVAAAPVVEQQAASQASADSSVRPSLEIGAVPYLTDLPELVQQAIPQMNFAGHVYSSNAQQRSVIINGRSMGEGDRVIEGLAVEQITHDGVVFNYRGQLFRMDILQNWSFDY